jgi:hypothetical protein
MLLLENSRHCLCLKGPMGTRDDFFNARKTALLNSAFEFYLKYSPPVLPFYVHLRAQNLTVSTMSCYRFRVLPAAAAGEAEVYRVAAGVETSLELNDACTLPEDTWLRLRATILDSGATVELRLYLRTETSWTELLGYVDETPHLYETPGRTGFGALSPGALYQIFVANLKIEEGDFPAEGG